MRMRVFYFKTVSSLKKKKERKKKQKISFVKHNMHSTKSYKATASIKNLSSINCKRTNEYPRFVTSFVNDYTR